MGCGASAVREHPLQSGPVGSARSLAQWKRNQHGQPKVVDCSLPPSIADVKAANEAAPSEVETNCGGCSTDGAPTEGSQSRPASREAMLADTMVADGVIQASADEIRCKQLRLRMSKTCVMAAKSGDLAAAFQQISTQSSKPEGKAVEIDALRELLLQGAEDGTLENALDMRDGTATQPKKVQIVAPLEKPSSRRPSRNKTAKTVEKLQTDTDKLQELKQKTKASLENGLMNDFKREESMHASSRPPLATNRSTEAVDLDGIKKRAVQSLEQLCKQGSLNSLLQESLESTSRPGASNVAVSAGMGAVGELEHIRTKVISCLEKAAASGSLEAAVSSSLVQGSNKLEHVRQKAVSCLMSAMHSGDFEKNLENIRRERSPDAPKASDDTVKQIKQRVAVSVFKATKSGGLAGALNDVMSKSAALENQKMKIRSHLEKAVLNGGLEKAIASMQV